MQINGWLKSGKTSQVEKLFAECWKMGCNKNAIFTNIVDNAGYEISAIKIKNPTIRRTQ